MALHGRSAARSSHSVVSIGASDPSSPKDLSLPPQERDRTYALSSCMTCVLTSRLSGAVVLWVRAAYSDCLSIFPAAQIWAGTLVARSTGLRQTSSTATSHQDAGSSIIRHNVVNLGPSTPSLSSPFSAPVIIMLQHLRRFGLGRITNTLQVCCICDFIIQCSIWSSPHQLL